MRELTHRLSRRRFCASTLAAAACSGPVGSKSVPLTSQPSAKPPLKFPNGFSCVRSWNVRLIERGLGSATPRVDDQNGQLPVRRNIRHPREVMAYRAFQCSVRDEHLRRAPVATYSRRT
jgi:hypothetical protein